MGMNDTVRVVLSMAQKAAKADDMARLLAEREAVESQKAIKVKEFNAAIAALDAQLAQLGTEVREGSEERAQRDLFSTDEILSKDAAAAALARVATDLAQACNGDVVAKECPAHGACICPDDARSSLDCPLHGPDSLHAKGPLPTEPHAFVAKMGYVGPEGTICETCGSNMADPIHLSEDEGGEAAAADPSVSPSEQPDDPPGQDLGVDPDEEEDDDDECPHGVHPSEPCPDCDEDEDDDVGDEAKP